MPTPKHDDMLLFFEENREKIIKFLISRVKEKTDINILVSNFDGKKHEYIDWSTEKIGEQNIRDANNEHCIYKLPKGCEKAGDEYYRIRRYYGEKDTVFSTKQGKLKEFSFDNSNREISNIEWLPEYTIKSRSYYIGSIDLLVAISLNDKTNLNIENNWTWKDFDIGKMKYVFITEFKPTIKSFSETMRQVNVYNSYFGHTKEQKTIIYIFTYSDISKWKETFAKQGIHLINMKELEDYLNQSDDTRNERAQPDGSD